MFLVALSLISIRLCQPYQNTLSVLYQIRPTPATLPSHSASAFCTVWGTIALSSRLHIPLRKIDAVSLHSPFPRFLSPLRSSLRARAAARGPRCHRLHAEWDGECCWKRRRIRRGERICWPRVLGIRRGSLLKLV
jgi:hypothetical protein